MPMKTNRSQGYAFFKTVAGLCRSGILIFFLIFNTRLAAAADSTSSLADHVSTTGKSASQNGGGISDTVLLFYDEKENADPLQWRLGSMLAKNGETGDERRQAAASEAAADEAASEESNPTHKWQTVLPILGEEAEAKGHTLPLAFGLMPGFYFGKRHISVSNAQVTIARMTIPADRLTDIRVKSRERNWSMRLDAWLFPFLNIYGLCGYTKQDTDAAVGVTPIDNLLKLLGKKPKDIDIAVHLTGVTYGFGFTLVGGYKNFFATYDSNYTISALRGDLPFDNTLSPDVKALLNSIRLGWRKQLAGDRVLNLWVGTTYWDTTNAIKGTPHVPVIGTVKFRLREKTSQPWSTHIGTNVELSKSFQLVVDMGSNFSGLFAIAPTLMYRF